MYTIALCGAGKQTTYPAHTHVANNDREKQTFHTSLKCLVTSFELLHILLTNCARQKANAL